MDDGENVKLCAIMSIPRCGWNANWGCIHEALRPFQIPIHRFSGVFWGQCMQRAFEQSLADGIDWVLCIDYDSLFMPEHVEGLLDRFSANPHIHALAATQSRRQSKFPLATRGLAEEEVEVDGSPLEVTTAHFGLTLLRVPLLEGLPKPWFFAQPDLQGEWGKSRVDDDIWFWNRWRTAGRTLYMDPRVRIGHLEEMVSCFDEQMHHHLVTVDEWRKQHGVQNTLSKIEENYCVRANAEAVAAPAAT